MTHCIKAPHHVLLLPKYQWRKQWYCGVGILQLFDLKDPTKKFPQTELWERCSQLLNLSKGEQFDLGVPKKQAEFLAAGHCFAPAGEPVEKHFVRIQCADRDKTLMVYGNRVWHEWGLTATVSAPIPFTKMPLTWAEAFGGTDFAPNPDGRGMDTVEPTAHDTAESAYSLAFPLFPQNTAAASSDAAIKERCYPLPNVEYPNQLVLTKSDRPTPASYYPVSWYNTIRLKKFGTYDGGQKREAYAYADDIDWAFFNSASSDQQYPNFFTGDEAFQIENMHPEESLIRGNLPGWRPRCFAQLQRDEVQYSEIELHLDTVWFLPEFMQGVVIWHGMIPIQDMQGSDVLAIHIEDETLAEPLKSRAEYEAIFLQKSHRDDVESARKKADEDFERRKAQALALAKENLKNGSFFKDKNVAAVMKQMQAQMDKVQQQLSPHFSKESQTKSLGTAPLDIKKTVTQWITKHIEASDNTQSANAWSAVFEKLGLPVAKDASMLDVLKQLRSNKSALSKQLVKPFTSHLHTLGVDESKLTKLTAAPSDSVSTEKALDALIQQLQTPEQAQALPPDTLQKLLKAKEQLATLSPAITLPHLFTRLALEAAYAAGESLAGQVFIDIDLRGIDLRGADLSKTNFCHCKLDYADFSGANITKTNFGNASLTHAKFIKAQAPHAIFSGANISDADFSCAVLTDAHFLNTHGHRARFSNADLSQATIKDADWSECYLDQVNAASIKLLNTHCKGAYISQVNFDSALINDIQFEDMAIDDTNFTNGTLKNITFSKVSLRNSQWDAVIASDVTWKESTLLESRWSRVVLQNCHLENVDIRQANWNKVVIYQGTLSYVQFQQCELVQMSANSKSVWAAVQFERCNMQQAAWLNCDLTTVTYQRCQLQHSFFDGSVLKETRFLYCDLQYARCFTSNLSGTEFYWSNLLGASLRQADLRAAVFQHCNLYGVDFYHAITGNTAMQGCLMSDPLPRHFEENFIHA